MNDWLPPCGLILLTEWQRRLLGISPAVAGQIDRAQLYLAGGWTMRAAIIVLASAALWFGFLYLRDGRRPSLWVKAPLLILRLVALAALVAMLFQPMLRLGHSQTIRPSVLVLVDGSESMGIRDRRLPQARAAVERRASGLEPARATRAEIVEGIANRPDVDLLGTLSRRYAVRVYRFGADAHALPAPGPVRRGGPTPLRAGLDPRGGQSTQIGTALRRALDDVAGQPVAGALILSDGGSNLGDDPASVAERAKAQGVPVSTLGVGDPTPTRDLAVTEALADRVVRKDGVVQVFAGISHRGYQGRTVTVTLRRGDTVVGARTVVLGPSSGKQTVAFTYTPKQVGEFAYTVSASALPGETRADNNRRRFLQRVVAKKLKILYVEGEPRWEYRYLKNAILRDTQIGFSCILVSAGSQTGGEGNVPIHGFPRDEESLFAFDILLLGDVPRTYFSDLQLRNVRRFVEDKGGSLVVICGEKHMPQEYRGTPLEGVFPVVLPAAPEQVSTEEAFRWDLTPAGRQDPLLRLSDAPEENARTWASLPGMFWNAGVERAKPGATVLAVNPARSNAYGKRIILAVQSFGAGRCLLSTVDSTWRWRWKVGDKYFYRYWWQAIRAMTPHEPPGGNRFAQVNADRSEYLLGDRVAIHARLLDRFYRAIKQTQVTGRLASDTGVSTPLILSSVPGSPGLYSADALADRLGRYTVTVASPANPAAKASAGFLVQSLALEQQQPEMNEALLKRVAAAGSGRYYQPDQLKQWPASLKVRAPVVRSESEAELWDAPVFLLIFITALGLEWLIRKRSGLL